MKHLNLLEALNLFEDKMPPELAAAYRRAADSYQTTVIPGIQNSFQGKPAGLADNRGTNQAQGLDKIADFSKFDRGDRRVSTWDYGSAHYEEISWIEALDRLGIVPDEPLPTVPAGAVGIQQDPKYWVRHWKRADYNAFINGISKVRVLLRKKVPDDRANPTKMLWTGEPELIEWEVKINDKTDRLAAYVCCHPVDNVYTGYYPGTTDEIELSSTAQRGGIKYFANASDIAVAIQSSYKVYWTDEYEHPLDLSKIKHTTKETKVDDGPIPRKHTTKTTTTYSGEKQAFDTVGFDAQGKISRSAKIDDETGRNADAAKYLNYYGDIEAATAAGLDVNPMHGLRGKTLRGYNAGNVNIENTPSHENFVKNATYILASLRPLDTGSHNLIGNLTGLCGGLYQVIRAYENAPYIDWEHQEKLNKAIKEIKRDAIRLYDTSHLELLNQHYTVTSDSQLAQLTANNHKFSLIELMYLYDWQKAELSKNWHELTQNRNQRTSNPIMTNSTSRRVGNIAYLTQYLNTIEEKVVDASDEMKEKLDSLIDTAYEAGKKANSGNEFRYDDPRTSEVEGLADNLNGFQYYARSVYAQAIDELNRIQNEIDTENTAITNTDRNLKDLTAGHDFLFVDDDKNLGQDVVSPSGEVMRRVPRRSEKELERIRQSLADQEQTQVDRMTQKLNADLSNVTNQLTDLTAQMDAGDRATKAQLRPQVQELARRQKQLQGYLDKGKSGIYTYSKNIGQPIKINDLYKLDRYETAADSDNATVATQAPVDPKKTAAMSMLDFED